MMFSTDFILGALSGVFALAIFWVVLKLVLLKDLTKTIGDEFDKHFGKWVKR